MEPTAETTIREEDGVMSPGTGTELAALDGHAELAAWLVRCPDAVIVTEGGTIHAALAKAGFEIGRAFVEARYRAAWCPRLEDGSLPATANLAVHAARSNMMAVVKGEDA